jgi:hypothetical protein
MGLILSEKGSGKRHQVDIYRVPSANENKHTKLLVFSFYLYIDIQTE